MGFPLNFTETEYLNQCHGLTVIRHVIIILYVFQLGLGRMRVLGL